MPRDSYTLEQDFILVTETEMRVRQATQYTQLHTALIEAPHLAMGEWDFGGVGTEELLEQRFDEDFVTVWERTLEQL